MDLNLSHLKALQDADAWPMYRAMVAVELDRPDIHLQGALIAQRLGQLHAAHHAILEALAHHPTGDLLGRIRFVHGTILRERGDIEGAIEQFTLWLREFQRYSALESSHLGACYYNRGLALRQAGRYENAVADYRQACGEFRRWDRTTWLCMALQNLAWAACLAGQPDIAAEALAGARPLSISPTSAWQTHVGEALLAATVPDSDPNRAISLCRKIIDSADPDIPASVRSHAHWVAARVMMDLGQFREVEPLVEQALLWGANARDEDRCLSDASALWQQLRAHNKGGDA